MDAIGRRLAWVCLPLVIALGGCEYVKDTGFVCLVPKDLRCDCGYTYGTDDGGSDCDEVPLDAWANDGIVGEVACDGTYPANVEYEVAAFLYEGGQGYATKVKCKAKVDGRHITVKGHFWHEPEQDAIREPGATTTCSVGTLSAGTWTLEFGDNSVDVEIGDPDSIQSMICVESGKQHSG